MSSPALLIFIKIRFDFYHKTRILAHVYGGRSSVGRASGCGSEGRGFNPLRSPHTSLKLRMARPSSLRN